MGAKLSTDVIKLAQTLVAASSLISDPTNIYPDQTTLWNCTCPLTDINIGCSASDWTAGNCPQTGPPPTGCSVSDWRAGKCPQTRPTGCSESDWKAGKCPQTRPTGCSESDWKAGKCPQTQPPGGSPPCDCKAYDYIVVGGGSAGCVVATRLAEDGKYTVLLIEAGPDPPITALLPGLFVTLPKSAVDYNYMSTYDPYAARGQGNSTTFTAGKMLGGSDSLNHLVHTRGCPRDYDKWVKATGDDSWSYANLLKYFIKSERLEDKEIINTNPEYHGTNGPMGLSRQFSKKLDKYLEAFNQIGHPRVLDLNANICIGYTQPQFMIAEQLRQTPALVYLGRVKGNSNLYVSKNTRATRIIFNGKVAVAVEAVYAGKTYILRACKEIILCAGVFNSPQLLMLSGIGHKDHLNKMGIKVKADLPVGDNLIEQVSTTVIYKTQSYLLPVINALGLEVNQSKFPFPLGLGSVALNKSQTYPDYQTFSGLLAHDTPYLTLVCRNTFWYLPQICDTWQKQARGRDVFYTLLTNVSPVSRGYIRLRSTNPFDAPVITSGFYKNNEDLENMVKYVKDFIKIGNSSYFKKLKAKLILDLAQCANLESGSDEYWRCYVRNTAISPYHYVSSCPLGTVLDKDLRVIGFENLRVADGSSIPGPISGGPNAPVIVIGEKAAYLIKSSAKRNSV